ncbi:MAG: DUF4861 domain-containing protein [Bacteroidales bacterium]|jgi:hypothetical protein|nr:DUF4861 domain-containing protein [Bacteroidales bacterium]
MKNWVIIILSIVTLASCKVNRITVELSNPSDVAREKTTVEMAWADIVAKLPAVDVSKIVIVNAQSGDELAHQVIYLGEQTPQMLIFQVTLAPKESVELLIKEGTPKQQVVAKTFGRFIPERKDDFAWENDRVVFRMYGPALANENPSNGVDLWLKKTEKLIVDQFYHDDLNNGKSYHVDHGEGLDCYKVGHALGAGGIAPFVNDTLWVGNHYATQKVLDNGPLRTTFRLTYDNLPVGKKIYSEEIVISIDAGSQLNKAVVSFDGDFTDIKVAAGIFLHQEDPGNAKTDIAGGYNAFGEIATSDAGVPAGRNYVATVIPDGKMTGNLKQQDHLLAVAPYKKGDKFTYYFGGGWSQWGFPTDEAWFDYVAAFAAQLKNPLKMTVK